MTAPLPTALEIEIRSILPLRLQDRIAVRDFVLNGDVADPLTFDIDLENELSIGDNLVISVLIFCHCDGHHPHICGSTRPLRP